MRNVISGTAVCAILGSMFATSVTFAQDKCEFYLRQNLASMLKTDDALSQTSKYSTIKKLSRKELDDLYKKESQSGNASVDVVLLWNASGGVNMSDESHQKALKEFSSMEDDSGSLRIDSRSVREWSGLDAAVVKILVDGYNECLRIEGGGLHFRPRRHADDTVTIVGTWIPKGSRDDASVAVTAVTPSDNLELVGDHPKQLDAGERVFMFRLKDPAKGATVTIRTTDGEKAIEIVGTPKVEDETLKTMRALQERIAALETRLAVLNSCVQFKENSNTVVVGGFVEFNRANGSVIVRSVQNERGYVLLRVASDYDWFGTRFDGGLIEVADGRESQNIRLRLGVEKHDTDDTPDWRGTMVSVDGNVPPNQPKKWP